MSCSCGRMRRTVRDINATYVEIPHVLAQVSANRRAQRGLPLLRRNTNVHESLSGQPTTTGMSTARGTWCILSAAPCRISIVCFADTSPNRGAARARRHACARSDPIGAARDPAWRPVRLRLRATGRRSETTSEPRRGEAVMRRRWVAFIEQWPTRS